MVSHPDTDSDLPIGSDRESGRDKLVSEPRFRRFWNSLCYAILDRVYDRKDRNAYV